MGTKKKKPKLIIDIAFCIIKQKDILDMIIVEHGIVPPKEFIPKLADVALLINIFFQRLFGPGGELYDVDPATIFDNTVKELISKKLYCEPHEILEINSGRKIITFDIIAIDKSKLEKTGKIYINIRRNSKFEKGNSRARLSTFDMILAVISLTELLESAGLTPDDIFNCMVMDTANLHKESFILDNHKTFQKIRKSYKKRYLEKKEEKDN